MNFRIFLLLKIKLLPLIYQRNKYEENIYIDFENNSYL
jgi:hypothetical protein